MTLLAGSHRLPRQIQIVPRMEEKKRSPSGCRRLSFLLNMGFFYMVPPPSSPAQSRMSVARNVVLCPGSLSKAFSLPFLAAVVRFSRLGRVQETVDVAGHAAPPRGRSRLDPQGRAEGESSARQGPVAA